MATPSESRFSHRLEVLQQLAQDVLVYAGKQGASACEVDVSVGFGQSVTVRCGEVETIEYNRDKGIAVSVYLGQRKGQASTSDFSPTAWRETVDAALNIARFTAADPCAGLPDLELLAIDTGKVDCDYYNYLRGDRSSANTYRGEYMTQYSWAEVTRSALRQQAAGAANQPGESVPPTRL